MKKLLLLTSFLSILISCSGNRIDVPAQVEIVGLPEEVRVVHVIEISAQMGTIFNKECETLAEDTGITPEMPGYEEFVTTCVTDKTNKFIEDFMTLIQQGSN